MKNLISKLLILSIFFGSMNLPALAGDTIKYVNRASIIAFGITATLDKQFTVRCVAQDINQTFTGTGETQSINILLGYGSNEIIIEGKEDCAFTSFIPVLPVISIDLSRSPSINDLLCISEELKSIDLSNCVNLETLHIEPRNGRLTDLDLSDCRALEIINCGKNQLSVLDINPSNNPAVKYISCYENKLPLSNLYALSEVAEIPYGNRFERQNLGTRRISVGDTIDYSSQKEFGGKATVFYVMNGIAYGFFMDVYYLAHPSAYTINNGMITFHTAGQYTVDMRNEMIIQNPQADPARGIVYIQVTDSVSVDEPQALSKIELYPNPTTGQLQITNDESGIKDVEIFDIYGRKILYNHLIVSSSNHLISIAHLPAGLYFVKISTDAGEVVRKVLKQ